MLNRTYALRFALFTALGLPLGGLGFACSSTSKGGNGGAGSGGDPGTGGATTGTAMGGNGGSGGSDGGGKPVTHPLAKCANPKALKIQGKDSGYVTCDDGSVDRVKAVACDTSAPACVGNEDFQNCTTDADCSGNQHCAHNEGGDGGGCDCVSPCATDADCNDTEVCLCAGLPGGSTYSTCLAADCHLGGDCDSGECGLNVAQGCTADAQISCRDLQHDDCRSDSNCAGDDNCYTPFDGTGHRVCQYDGCTGRLLRDAFGLVVTPSSRRSDWAEGRPFADANALPEATRRMLAEHWTEVAATEHAAVASFARFSLQLLAVAAPPEFLAEAQRAAAEEIEHARRAYAIASAFAGESIGPGALDTMSLPLATTRMGLISGLIDDACVSELVNVSEVQAIAEVATDAAVREFAARTATEEEAHVTLAWRVLRWALEGASTEERRVARTQLEARIATLASALDPSEKAAPEYGVLSARERLAIRRQVLREVATPAVQACFADLERRSTRPDVEAFAS
jgi:hypothetical protein